MSLSGKKGPRPREPGTIRPLISGRHGHISHREDMMGGAFVTDGAFTDYDIANSQVPLQSTRRSQIHELGDAGLDHSSRVITAVGAPTPVAFMDKTHRSASGSR